MAKLLLYLGLFFAGYVTENLAIRYVSVNMYSRYYSCLNVEGPKGLISCQDEMKSQGLEKLVTFEF